MKVLVVGAGAAGTAAAFQAHALGADVRLVHDRAGATEWSSGAADLFPWTQRGRSTLDVSAREFLSELGLWRTEPDTRIATSAGVVRPANGSQQSLLNLGPLAGRTIGVPDVERDDWDAELLVRALRESGWARATGTRFETVQVPMLQHGFERRICAHDFAALHNEDDRRKFFCERLGNAAAPDGWLVGPWLGTDLSTASAVSEALGVPVGETTSAPGGPAGARFAAARALLFERLALDVRQGRISELARRGTRWQATLSNGTTLTADAVVLAIGGVAAGGIVLQNAIAQVSGAGFALSVDAPVELMVKQRPLESVASEHGFDFAAHGVGVLDHVGARPAANTEGLCLAGDVVAGRPNTVLMAVDTGLSGARGICRQGAT